jgi:CelD/BcsL family acetyltransferase involved in cellulose biosynthesis
MLERIETPARSLSLSAVTTLDELEALEGEWARLWARCSGATPFQHPAWLLAWCRQFQPVAPRVLALRRGARLVGIAPLLIYREGEQRVVGLLGGGVSDYLDVLFEPGLGVEGAAQVWLYLEQQRSAWDICRFEQLRPTSPVRELARACRCPVTWEIQEVCPALSLPARVEDLGAVVSARVLHDAHYNRRRMARAGAWRVSWARPEQVPAYFDALVRLHRARWQARGEAGMLADARIARFHLDALPGLARAGLVRACELSLDGCAIAVSYALYARGHVYHYLTGFDPQFQRFSPGKLLVLEALEAAIQAGDATFDFLRGSERYKYMWGARDRAIQRLSIVPRSQRERGAAP